MALQPVALQQVAQHLHPVGAAGAHVGNRAELGAQGVLGGFHCGSTPRFAQQGCLRFERTHRRGRHTTHPDAGVGDYAAFDMQVQREADGRNIVFKALGNFVNIFNPEVIVLDGFLGGLFEFDSERLISGIKANSLAAANERVVLRTGGLGSDLLMIGAALLPFSELTASPSGTQLYPAKAKAAKP